MSPTQGCVVVAAILLTAALGAPRGARAGPKFDCGKGVEVIFCPLRIPAFVIQARLDFAEAVMDHGENVAFGILDGINFYGELVNEMADRITTTEALIVDVAEDLLPGVILARTLERGVANLSDRGGDDLLPHAILDANSLVIRQQTLRRPQRPDLTRHRAQQVE